MVRFCGSVRVSEQTGGMEIRSELGWGKLVCYAERMGRFTKAKLECKGAGESC